MNLMSPKRRIELKSDKDLNRMRRACRLNAQVLLMVSQAVKPGISTKELDHFAEKAIRDGGGIPTFLGYRGYVASLCTSVNEEVVHGIPSAQKILKEGDILSIDVGTTLDGFVGDAAVTVPVGRISAEKQKLLDVTRESLGKGIEQTKIGNRLGDISHAIQAHAESKGYGIVRDFVGHGIGRQMHEEPAVPNFGEPATGMRLEKGLVLALEPMVTVGTWKVRVLDDKWTVVTLDGRMSAHFEHTVAVTETGPEVLTKIS